MHGTWGRAGAPVLPGGAEERGEELMSRVQVVMDKATVVACLGGDLDATTIDAVQRQLLDCADGSTCRALVVDLRSVASLDSKALAMLMRLRGILDERDQRLYLVVADVSTFVRTDVDEALAIHRRLGDALTPAGSA
jgi:anti-anti-sigma factor